MGYPEQYGGQDAVGRSVAGFETLAYGDLSLLVKCGVQFGLFGGAVLHLGTERHHERYLARIARLELPGCFAMTETGHGSNVQALRTTATYDPDTEEFVVHTPDDDARKDYIGGAARDGRLAAVFAQLVVGGEPRGVHALLVPIRDEDGTVLDGVRIEDCGAKLGLDGVDNGRIWFDHVRVPREALLDRYASVTADGTYSSPIENPTKRFFTMLGTLIQGRVSVCGAAINATKVAPGHRRPPRPAPPPVRPARRARGACSWTTARTSGGCCPRSPRPTRCTSPRPACATTCTRSSPSRARAGTTAAGASSRRSPRGSRPSRPGTRPTRSRRAARRAAARATCGRTASPR